jgi:Flp pilus assembly protein TadG
MNFDRETKKKMKQGQALVEFALALPLVLLLVLGVLEFGRAFQTKIVLTNAAREGTHYFIYDREDASNNFDNTRLAVQAEVVNSGVSFDDAMDDIDILCFIDADADGEVDGTDSDGDGFVDSDDEVDNTCPNGSTVVIYVEKMFNLAVIGTFVDPLPIHSDARMLVP